MTCTHCGSLIPTARQKALPGVDTCVACSSEQKKVAVWVYRAAGNGLVVEAVVREKSLAPRGG